MNDTKTEVRYTRRNEIEEAWASEVGEKSEQRKGNPEVSRRLEEEAWAKRTKQ